jgi:hypothetical protein
VALIGAGGADLAAASALRVIGGPAAEHHAAVVVEVVVEWLDLSIGDKASNRKRS